MEAQICGIPSSGRHVPQMKMTFNIRVWWLADDDFTSDTRMIEASSKGEALALALEAFKDQVGTFYFVGLEGEPEVAAARFTEDGNMQIIPMPWLRRA